MSHTARLSYLQLNYKPLRSYSPSSLHRGHEKHVQFPNELVFDDLVKDGDSKEMVSFLRRQSVEIDLDRFNGHGTTALADLIRMGNLKCVRVLVSLGANVNQRDVHGWTPLHQASAINNLSIAHYLIENGANPDIHNSQGFYPVDYTDDFEMIELLTLSSPSAQYFSWETFSRELRGK